MATDTRKSLDAILKEPRPGYYKEDIAKGGEFYRKSDKYRSSKAKSNSKALNNFKKALGFKRGRYYG